jgi:hypothetical protein
MNAKLSWAIRVAIVVGAGAVLLPLGGSSPIVFVPAALTFGLVLFFVVGWPLLKTISGYASRLFNPGDSRFHILPEYGAAEARFKEGRYADAIVEFRKVTERFPTDIQAHLRMAEIMVEKLNSPAAALPELLAAVQKSNGTDSLAISSHRLADLYQHHLHEPGRAMEVMCALVEKLPGSRHAQAAQERIARLKEAMIEGEPPKRVEKIKPRPSRYNRDEHTYRLR